MRLKTFGVGLVFLVASSCVTPKTYLRVATATAADLKEAEKKTTVWYEFQPGDVVPFQFLFFGVLEGGAPMAPLRTKKLFYLVAQKDRPLMVSFNGSTFADSRASQSIVAVLPRPDQEGAHVAWIHYLGQSLQPEKELKELMSQESSSESR